MDSWRLTDNGVRDNAIEALLSVDLDGHTTMVLRDSDTRSNRQLALLWKLFRFIAKSGKGDANTAEKVNVKCKWKYLRPMLMANDPQYVAAMQTLERDFLGNPKMMEFLTSKIFHFSDLSIKEMSECLTEIINDYGSKGIYLPIHGEDDLLSRSIGESDE